MFQNTYQSGQFFELFDPKGIYNSDLANRDKDKVYRMIGSTGFHRIYDKQLKGTSKLYKGYVLEVEDNKALFPRDDKLELCLLQEYLHLQLWVESTANFTLELIMSDTVKTKKRIILSNTIGKVQTKPFLTRISSGSIQSSCWINACFNLNGFVMGSKGQKYRALEGISIAGTYKLRRIFTTKNINVSSTDSEFNIKQDEIVPKIFMFPPSVPHRTIMFESQSHITQIDNTQEISTIVSINSKESHKHLFSTPRPASLAKYSINKSLEEKHFISNTANVDEVVMKLKRNDKSMHPPLKAEMETISYKSNNKEPSYNVEKKTTSKFLKRNIAPPTNKLNPWRAQKNSEAETDGDQRGIMSAQFKKTQKKVEKIIQKEKKAMRKHELSSYSDSDYLQMSQKFCTVTDPKVFRYESATKEKQQMMHYQRQEQIEQAIEMQNSIHQSQVKQSQNNQPQTFVNNYKVNESRKGESQMMKTQDGFTQKHIRQYFEQVQRPYTPPISNVEDYKETMRTTVQNKQVELIYDPIIKCYYDYKTNTYYELKS